ncbi:MULTISPECIES: nucleotide exchange factor GrpE [Bacillales]|uniref:nucleotide exchange factor GrpE n=1 Tax=Brevibacillus TaxID=55080 RepID=UPI000E3A1D82|nr:MULTISPECIES: nucleotide exchange factor GrpE [Bacillales]MDT3414528.1 molecular chaperone GrpE [Brevibacillus aydinogluensis]NNV02467.1 nucleotide exchange factor GrpE [Brevibacillus sp. MCWH]REK64641.1 MAG: nucleotide exchange factor GrpE [Brevibacillus sp.]
MNEDKLTRDHEQEAEAAAAEQQETADQEQQEAAAQEQEPAAEIDWQQEAERWKAQAEENHNRMLRALADMENLRRRTRKEQEDLAKYASLKVISELLPVIDNFERALSADKDSMTVESLLEGVNMVYRQMLQIFEREGLTAIQATGQPFDPNVHQAVMQAQDPAYESGVVVEEFQKGYLFKDRVIRPAMVKVNA